MTTIHERTEEIRKLTPQERVALYLAASAAAAAVGARLRAKYAGVQTDHDEGWTDDEQREFEEAGGCDQEAAWYAMSAEEQNVATRCDALFLSPLCRGEWPVPGEVPPVTDRRDVDGLTVCEESPGRFCASDGKPGAAIVGRGGSPVEAVGDYAINTALVRVRTEPPELVDTRFRLSPDANRARVVLVGCDRRD